MNINEAFPSKFLSAEDLQGREITVIMDHVIMEEVGNGNDKKTKPVLYFRGKQKGLALNKTNSTNIAAIYGPNTDTWQGQPVILFTAWVDYQGKSVQAIRVRPGQAPQQTRQAPPPPPADDFAQDPPF